MLVLQSAKLGEITHWTWLYTIHSTSIIVSNSYSSILFTVCDLQALHMRMPQKKFEAIKQCLDPCIAYTQGSPDALLSCGGRDIFGFFLQIHKHHMKVSVVRISLSISYCTYKLYKTAVRWISVNLILPILDAWPSNDADCRLGVFEIWTQYQGALAIFISAEKHKLILVTQAHFL